MASPSSSSSSSSYYPGKGMVTGLLAVLAALYCGLDPWKQGSMADFPGFKSYYVQVPSHSEIPVQRDAEDLLQGAEIRFFGQVQGPESIAFDPSGRGPYTGVADGRIVFWDGNAWHDFAYTSPNRSAICDPMPNPSSYLKNEHICGRPLGLRFHKKTGYLYIADAYFGILRVGPEGGLAIPITTEAEGIPFKFTNDLDVDDEGNIYFTDSSSNYQRRNFMQLIFTGEPSGRLLKYDSITKETTVLLRDLQFPNGVSLGKDGSFLVFGEGSRGRLSRYWLKGEKEGTSELFAILRGFPDNVRTNEDGDFWVALHFRRTFVSHLSSVMPRVRSLLLRLPVPAKYHYLLHIGGKLHAALCKYSSDGKLLRILEDSQGKTVKAASEVEERDGKLWIGSVLMPFVAVFPLEP